MWPRFPADRRRSASLEAVQGVTLRKTHKFLCAWEIKELHEPKVVSRDNVQASVGHTRAVDISLVCVSWPDANDFISQNAVPIGRGVRQVDRWEGFLQSGTLSQEREGNSAWSRGSSGRMAPVPSRSEYLAQVLLFSAPVPFTLKRKVTSIFDSLPLPYDASEYM